MTGNHSERISLPFDEWPASDKALWEELLREGDHWGGDAGAGSHWAAGTKKMRLQYYGTWLAFIRSWEPDILDLAPADRVTMSTISAYIDTGQKRLKSKSIGTALIGIASIMSAVFSDRDWNWLFNAAHNFNRKAEAEPRKPLAPVSAAEILKDVECR